VASLDVVSPDCAEAFFFGRDACCGNLRRAGSLVDLRDVLECRLGDFITPATLDLIGHSSRDHYLLRLGDAPIGMRDPCVARFFRALVQGRLVEGVA
jgi:hypothetical protein